MGRSILLYYYSVIDEWQSQVEGDTVLQSWFHLEMSGWQGSPAFSRKVNEICSSALLNGELGIKTLLLPSKLLSLFRGSLMALSVWSQHQATYREPLYWP